MCTHSILEKLSRLSQLKQIFITANSGAGNSSFLTAVAYSASSFRLHQDVCISLLCVVLGLLLGFCVSSRWDQNNARSSRATPFTSPRMPFIGLRLYYVKSAVTDIFSAFYPFSKCRSAFSKDSGWRHLIFELGGFMGAAGARWRYAHWEAHCGASGRAGRRGDWSCRAGILHLRRGWERRGCWDVAGLLFDPASMRPGTRWPLDIPARYSEFVISKTLGIRIRLLSTFFRVNMFELEKLFMESYPTE